MHGASSHSGCGSSLRPPACLPCCRRRSARYGPPLRRSCRRWCQRSRARHRRETRGFMARSSVTPLRGSAKHIAQRNHPYCTFCTTTARNARLTKKPPRVIALASPPIRTIQNPRGNLQSRSNKLDTFSSLQSRSNKLDTFSSGLGWLILSKTGAQNKAQSPAFLPRGVQGV